jgi:hypothetical protein
MEKRRNSVLESGDELMDRAQCQNFEILEYE